MRGENPKRTFIKLTYLFKLNLAFMKTNVDKSFGVVRKNQNLLFPSQILYSK